MKCKCPVAGYCATHQRNMTQFWHDLCASDDGYFGAFQVDLARKRKRSEDGVGPNDGSQCEHRGDLIDVRKCDTCGNRQKKEPVYQCSLYGECSDWDRFRSVRACRWCQDFTPRPQFPPA